MKHKKLLVAVIILIAIVASFFIFVKFNAYQADENALSYISNPADGVTVEEQSDRIVFAPEDAKTGFIFYPGAGVEAKAYAPIMESCAEKGILVIDAKMPINYAIFRKNAADDILKDYPEIEHWFIGGHSLGGAMACYYLADDDNWQQFDGLIMLASFSAVDLSDCDFDSLSIYGSNDQVLNMEKFNSRVDYLPNLQLFEIEGGNHGQFGSYGPQKGDGEADISAEEQTEITTEYIIDFINEVEN